MYQTKNTLPEKIRTASAAILQDNLVRSIDIMLQAKQAHWNVKGPQFIALHELFDKITEDSEEWVDNMAERIVQFGLVAEGTVQVVAQKTKQPVYPLKASSGREHLQALSDSLSAYATSVRSAIDETGKLGDADTADLFTGVSRAAEKYLWFLEAHLQGEK
jgi:starvation-inducible DNA-binding protein